MLKLNCRKGEVGLDAVNTHVGDEEDETAREENGSACDCKGEEETSGVVHESSDHRTDCQTKVERCVAPSLHSVVWLERGWKFTVTVVFLILNVWQIHLNSCLSVREPGHQDGEVGSPSCCCSHTL